MKYSELVPAPKILVRKATVEAMVEHGAFVERLIESGRLKPVNPGEKVELFRVKDVEVAVERYILEGGKING